MAGEIPSKPELTVRERDRRDDLTRLEGLIGRKFDAYMEVGSALLEIRRRKLYRVTEHGTFEAYCAAKWGISGRTGYRLMAKTENLIEEKKEPTAAPVPEDLPEPEPIAPPDDDPDDDPDDIPPPPDDVVEVEPPPDEEDAPQKIDPEVLVRVSEKVRFDTVAISVIELKKQIELLIRDGLGSFINKQRIETDMRNIYTAIKWAKPYKVCGYCGSRGCKACKGQGWLNKDTWDAMPKALKE
jgi:hypothetical protein